MEIALVEGRSDTWQKRLHAQGSWAQKVVHWGSLAHETQARALAPGVQLPYPRLVDGGTGIHLVCILEQDDSKYEALVASLGMVPWDVRRIGTFSEAENLLTGEFDGAQLRILVVGPDCNLNEAAGLFKRWDDVQLVICGQSSPALDSALEMAFAYTSRTSLLKEPFSRMEAQLVWRRLGELAQARQQQRAPVRSSDTGVPVVSAWSAADSLLSSAQDVVYLCRADGSVRFVSKAFSAQFDLPVTKFVSEYEARFSRAAETTSRREPRFLELSKADGNSCNFELRESPLPGFMGGGYVGVAREISARERMEVQLRRESKLEAVRGMALGLAHELNDLLTVIGVEADMLASSATSDSARTIIDTTERAAELARRLMDFGQESPGQRQLLELSQLTRDTLTLFGRTIPKAIELELDLCPSARVLGSSSEFTTVLLSMLAHAVDALPHGGRIRIKTEVDSEDSPRALRDAEDAISTIVLTVEDSGPGLSEAAQKRLFDPFYSEKIKSAGRGLGMSVARSVVEGMGGSMLVESELGEGTRTLALLPSYDKVESRRPAPLVDMPGHGQLILLVEDEPRVRSLTTRVLERAGYEVLGVGVPTEALELDDAVLNRVGLMVSDVIMPRLSGPQLYERLKQRRHDLRAIFVTGYAAEDLGNEVFAATGLLRKPWKRDELLYAVERCLEV